MDTKMAAAFDNIFIDIIFLWHSSRDVIEKAH